MTVSTSPRLLVVDDNKVMHRIVERIVRGQSVELIISAHAPDTMRLIAQHRPALVLLDIVMPGLHGTSVVNLIRSDPEIARTCVVLHSSISEEELAQRARAYGADGFIAKSRGINHLEQSIAQWLHRSAPAAERPLKQL
jgi:CheY-like chemotaxis protein